MAVMRGKSSAIECRLFICRRGTRVALQADAVERLMQRTRQVGVAVAGRIQRGPWLNMPKKQRSATLSKRRIMSEGVRSITLLCTHLPGSSWPVRFNCSALSNASELKATWRPYSTPHALNAIEIFCKAKFVRSGFVKMIGWRSYKTRYSQCARRADLRHGIEKRLTSSGHDG